MKRFLSSLLVLVLVVAIGLTGCSNGSAVSGVTGNYTEDTLALVETLREAISLPEGTAEKRAAQAEAKQQINTFAARYRRDNRFSDRPSFITIQTALNSLAGHYSSYPNRPLPEKLQERIEKEFKQVERAIARESA